VADSLGDDSLVVPVVSCVTFVFYRNVFFTIFVKKENIKRDFYFRALRSLVVLSFPQPLSFSSVFPSL
jgi:hypothetical protein